MVFDGSKELWDLFAQDRELARDALRVLEGMHPCADDRTGVEAAKNHLREAIRRLNESLGSSPPPPR
jgi:hypothetical protein